MTDFSKRLKELMDSERISCRALAIKTDSQRESILNWLNGLYYPRYDALIRLADYFKVSCDYLLGESDDFSIVDGDRQYAVEQAPKIFHGRMKTFMKKEGISMYRLAKNLEIGQSTLSKWINSGEMPEVPKLIKLSRVMDESVDYLLGRN